MHANIRVGYFQPCDALTQIDMSHAYVIADVMVRDLQTREIIRRKSQVIGLVAQVVQDNGEWVAGLGLGKKSTRLEQVVLRRQVERRGGQEVPVFQHLVQEPAKAFRFAAEQ
jgi:hypothetical protein